MTNEDSATRTWRKVLEILDKEFNTQTVDTWLRPLEVGGTGDKVQFRAQSDFVYKWVKDKFWNRICDIFIDLGFAGEIELVVVEENLATKVNGQKRLAPREGFTREKSKTRLSREWTFDNYVQGKTNQLAIAAAKQAAENPGGSEGYNPLYVYGGVGLGKTHLMHALGNRLVEKYPDAKVLYVQAEDFVNDMVKALSRNDVDWFKKKYRNLDVLLIDDIQFFANKDRTQEEFFHTFNALFQGQRQIVISCDRYPREVEGLEERLKSRFGWGLTVAIEPYDLETRQAILLKKAEERGVELPESVSFFIAQTVPTNARELEGALNTVIARARFQNKPIDTELAKEALKDVIGVMNRAVSVDNIKKIVAEYYKIKVSDLTSKSRARKIARPRQIAMSLAKELTRHSLPEIGREFGGRDHTTVLHACRQIHKLRNEDPRLEEEYRDLERMLMR